MKGKYKNEQQSIHRWKRARSAGLYLGVLVFSVIVILLSANWTELSKIFNDFGRAHSNVLGASYLSLDAGVETQSNITTSSFVQMDYRAFVLEEYFRINESPLRGTGHLFIKYCLQYDSPLDCTIVAAIARAETDLCKYYTSASYYNCWGYGGAGPNRIYFSSWNQSIERVYRTLAWGYGYKYMIDPTLMERRFCGWEPGCTGWGKRVIHFMDEINELSIAMGFGSLYDLRDR